MLLELPCIRQSTFPMNELGAVIVVIHGIVSLRRHTDTHLLHRVHSIRVCCHGDTEIEGNLSVAMATESTPSESVAMATLKLPSISSNQFTDFCFFMTIPCPLTGLNIYHLFIISTNDYVVLF